MIDHSFLLQIFQDFIDQFAKFRGSLRHIFLIPRQPIHEVIGKLT